ncbi:MAG: hypothetical protein RSB59_04740, partial [Clostridia bacterium]
MRTIYFKTGIFGVRQGNEKGTDRSVHRSTRLFESFDVDAVSRQIAQFFKKSANKRHNTTRQQSGERT